MSHIPLPDFREYPPDEMARRAEQFHADLRRRRTVRHFSDRPVPRGVIELAVRTAGTAPNGANLQPWHFAVVSDVGVKRRIRQAAEAEEREFYARRATAEWKAALAPLGTDADKPFLETAPYLIAVSVRTASSEPVKHYYVSESVGIACGFLIAALHHSGLATLTHTPSPMGFLNTLLGRPEHERAYLLLVVGYPAADATVPDITRKPLGDICSWV
jgi:iodotyrosine deiodinase